MPKKRIEPLYVSESWDRGGTFKKQLPISGDLAGLLVVAEGSCVSGATLASELTFLEQFLDKVQILGDGSTIIESVDWQHLTYFNYLDTGRITPHWKRNYASGTQRACCLIPFGRYPWDTEYGLILDKWNRVEISLLNNTSSTYHSASLSVWVTGMFFEDLPNPFPRGYLRKEEIKEWLTVASALEQSQLPTTNPLRGVHLQIIPDLDSNYVSEDSMYNVAYNVDFAIQRPKRFLYRQNIWHQMLINAFEQPGLPLTMGFLDKTAEYGVDVGLGYVYGMSGISGSKDDAVSSSVPTIDGDNNVNTQILENREADSPVQWMASGLCPNNCVTLHYVRDADPQWLLDPAQIGSLDLDITTKNAAASADGTIRILLDSVYQHPIR